MTLKKQVTNSSLKFAILATDVVCFRIIDRRLSVLLGKVTTVPDFAGKWALIGGLILPDETADQSVERHLSDKAGVGNVFKEQLYTFSDIDRDPRGRVVSVAYMALTPEDIQDISKARVETRWFPINNIPQLAYDHNKIIDYGIARLRAKIGYTNIIQYLLPEEFTLSELQAVYETVAGKRSDKRNFRKKILASGILNDTKLTRKQGVMRPAALYEFSSKEILTIDLI